MADRKENVLKAAEMHPGRFVGLDDDGKVHIFHGKPPADFVILAKAWALVWQHNAVAVNCSGCGISVGLAQNSQRILRENPQQVVLCLDCGAAWVGGKQS